MFVEAPWLSWLKRLSSSNWGLNKDHRRQLYKTVAERMILHGSVEWAASLSARQKRVLNSIQRNFLLNISRAYFTNPSAALQVIEGSLPLHLKAELEAAYVRLKQQISLDGRGFPPADYEEKPATTRLHPAAFQLEDRISFTKTVSQEEETNIYTDGSHLNNQTGCAFCVIKNEEITSDWMGKLRNENSVFQAELTAIKEACHWAINQDLQIKIWSDSESSLHSIQAINTKSAIAQEIQEVLLNSTNIRLGSVKAHADNKGYEIADQLAKRATTEGSQINIHLPNSQLKKQLKAVFLKRWQEEWDTGETGRTSYKILPKVKRTQTGWEREEIMFVTGHRPFPSYLHRFHLRESHNCGCGQEGTPFHYATSSPLTTSFQFYKPSALHEPAW
ncbi:uncharacterized protein LOC129974207 [Argiope bruennichi]|uniref:uncharacterized protein LOC129974207 n=1 Tax=Argiope bruennichi TaxID=94029 RepID=UPI0024958E42|nr:uncharacterized protein LOC129974207 [Argiope bruennichi]